MSIGRIGIDVVMAAMEHYADRKSAHDKALSEYDGYSWDWAGESWISAMEESRAEAEKALNDYIDEVVKRSIAEVLKAKP